MILRWFRSRPARKAAAMMSVLLLGGTAALTGAAGCGPSAFDPANGCQALTSCDLCASRGGCGWCASACVAVDGAQCGTPIIKASNLCPGATPSATATP